MVITVVGETNIRTRLSQLLENGLLIEWDFSLGQSPITTVFLGRTAPKKV